ncbi:MAG: hypothetical protein ISS87_02505 [Candidatus Pacebacteria bacterium]|nr:hypothetical protein [Candidatus Paceibacterota bacterium]
MRKKLLLILFVSVFSLVLAINSVNAAGVCEECNGGCDAGLECIDGKCRGCPQGAVTFCNPLSSCDLQELIDKIISFLILIAFALVPLIVLIGAFFIMTSADDPKKRQTGMNMILYAAIGLGVILFSKGIISIIRFILEGLV